MSFIHRQGEGATIRQQVGQFHVEMNQPIGEKPAVPADDRVRFRLRLIAEEFFETLEACVWEPGSGDELSYAKHYISRLLDRRTLKVDLPEFIDGLGDLDYVIEGARLEFGVDGAPIADAIHAANMAKASGPMRPDGKRLKPEGWTPPDIEGELVKQGWVKP